MVKLKKNVKGTDEGDSIQGKQSQENNIMLYAAGQYTMADLNLLSDSELIALIPTLQWYQITDLFQYNDGAQQFYSNKTRMAALLRELEVRGRSFTTTDSLGIPTFIEIIRAGYYLGFYNSQLGYLDTIAEKNKCVPAITALVNNPNFGFGTTVQDEIVASTGLFANAAFVNTAVVNKLANVVKNYVDNVNTYINDFDKGTAVFNLLSGTNYAISSYVRMSGTTATNSEFYGRIDSFINQVMRIANLPTLTEQNAWLINNGIYYTGELADYLSDKSQANRTLTKAIEIYPYLGQQYFEALDKIATKFNSVDYNGKKINYSKAIEDGKAHHLPKTYTFDNGTMIIKTGNNVSEEKVKRLYWASKEVKAQFFRMYGSDKALEPGNPDDRLEMIIYNTPGHYEMNRYLYGLDTNNGGIYIEPDGRFFTYERTPQDSIYSLEELFRHEFTHYLQGRYLVPGMWGYGSIYQNERLTWYEEGGAELFAGATRTEGIKMRQSMVGNIANNQSNRLSLKNTLYAKYGSFEFYTYAFVFMSYLYENDLAAFNKLAKYINTSDVTNYDAYRSELSLSSKYNSEYDAYMQKLYESYPTLTTPLVSDDYLLNHPTKLAQEVYNKIGQVATLNNVRTSINSSPMFNTFTLKGTYTGTVSAGYEADWKSMNTLVDSFLVELSKEQWSGYKTLTAYFTDYKLDANNNFVFDVTFTGIAPWDATAENILPVVNINGPYSEVEGGNIMFSSAGSNDQDGTIASYLWTFGDGTQSTEANPTHAYEVAGSYEVTLTVTDNLGATSKASTTVTINPKTNGPISQETEGNNSVETANGPIVSDVPISASFDANDSLDYYYLEISEPSTINITVNNFADIKLNWLLYSANDTNQYIAYPEISGNSAVGSYVAQPGKYYINVYKTEGVSSNYTLTVNIVPKGGSTVITESESNDTFETSDVLALNSTLVGNLNDDDYTDNFTFDVSQNSTLKIDVTLQSDAQANWVLYNANNMNEYYSYSDIVNGTLTNQVVMVPGKYFLRIYKIQGTTAPYELKINEVE